MDEKEKYLTIQKVIPFKWRIQSERKITKDEDIKNVQAIATCVAYLEPRDVAQVLDDVFGSDGWQDEYYEIQNSIYCKVGIWSNKRNQFIWKSDAGECKRDYLIASYLQTDNSKRYKLHNELENASKTQATDAFKRACVKHGIGRFQYYMDSLTVNTKGYDVINSKGEPVCYKGDNELLSKYVNRICPVPEKLLIEIDDCTTEIELKNIFDRMYSLQKNKSFIDKIREKKDAFL
jgi:hypothetical protein